MSLENKTPILGVAGLLKELLFDKDSPIVDIFKGKERKKREFEAKLFELERHERTQQIEVNKIEAQHSSIFVSGWRPACGWLCVVALAYHFIIMRFLVFILAIFNKVVEVPELEISGLVTLLTSLLGLGAIRTYEKLKLK